MIYYKKLAALAVFLSCLMLLIPTASALTHSTSDAAERLDTTAACSLTLEYKHESRVFVGTEIRLYRVAALNEELTFALDGEFSATGLILNGIKSSREWATVTSTLESYIASKAPAPCAVGRTLDDGKISFGSLGAGLYFVMPLTISESDAVYIFGAAIVSVPSLDDGGHWVYDASATPKSEVVYPSDEPEEPTDYTVTKLWKGDTSATRPTSIVVDIIRNGEVVKTVTLSAQNNWTYSWQSTNSLDSWQVAEKVVPDGYTVTIDKHDTAFTVINTADIPGDEPPPDEPPPTGDTTNIGAYLLLASLAGVLLAAVGLIPRRKA